MDLTAQIEAQFAEQVGPTLWVVATPIGHLGDLSPRARVVLERVGLIAAEDTRQTRQLLQACAIKAPELVSYHDHNERHRAQTIVERMQREDLSVALVSDAGTPVVSDPGLHLVQACRAADIPVIPVPGPSAVATLISAAGLAPMPYTFVGFLPTKAKARTAAFQAWAHFPGSVVYFESCPRLAASLKALTEVWPDAQVAIGRELTKKFEEIVVQPVVEACDWAESHASLKGEVVVMVQLPERIAPGLDEAELRAQVRQDLAAGETAKTILERLRDCGLSRNELYALIMDEKNRS